MTKNEKLCMVPECHRQLRTRGICSACYLKARNMIDSGEVTEKELVERGLLRERRGLGEGNPLKLALDKARKAEG